MPVALFQVVCSGGDYNRFGHIAKKRPAILVGAPEKARPTSRPPELDAAVALMEKYADTPMDFADATLVLLAEALDVHDILTLDRSGFSTFRTRPGRALRLVLDLADPGRRHR